MDWSGCPLIVSRPGYLSGMPALRDDPRVPPETVMDNMDEGLSAQDVIELFALRTSVSDILAIYEYSKKLRVQRAV